MDDAWDASHACYLHCFARNKTVVQVNDVDAVAAYHQKQAKGILERLCPVNGAIAFEGEPSQTSMFYRCVDTISISVIDQSAEGCYPQTGEPSASNLWVLARKNELFDERKTT
jgi:lipocalin